MKKFKIEFVHTVENLYTCVVEAETKEEAIEIFNDSPFDCDEIPDEPLEKQGLEIKIMDVKKI
ncbi:MAG: hypothetical protein LBC19_04620 [Tannerella sp.]|jgi:hypothetical protein|nr:hypothetical protein [Tannerella sp.]